MQLSPNKKVYFFSDLHLGTPDWQESLAREKTAVRFLEEIKHDAQAIFLVGDLFDFWFEYKHVVPKGFVRILGKLAELTDQGVEIYFFVGNHDMWMKTYFQQELRIPVYYEPQKFVINSKKFYIGHGDGLGPGDHGYKALKKVFRNPVSQFLFGLLPPVIGMGVANFFSRKSREADSGGEKRFLGEDREWLISYSKQLLQKEHYDYLVFGHRHLPIDYSLQANNVAARYINLGEWMNYATYAVFDGNNLELKSFTGQEDKIFRSR